MEGVTEPTAPRSTASQMQRGSGELQSTPTGFWKLQSAPAGAGHGSIAAGIGAWRSLRSTSLTAHIGCSHAHTRGRGPETAVFTEARGGEDGWFRSQSLRILGGSSLIQQAEIPLSRFRSIVVGVDLSGSLIPRGARRSSREPLARVHPLAPGADGGLLGSRWRSVCGTGLGGRSGFTTHTRTHTHTEWNSQRPSRWCPVRFCIQSQSVHPQNTHCCPRGLDSLSLSPPSHCPLFSLVFPLFFYLYWQTNPFTWPHLTASFHFLWLLSLPRNRSVQSNNNNGFNRAGNWINSSIKTHSRLPPHVAGQQGSTSAQMGLQLMSHLRRSSPARALHVRGAKLKSYVYAPQKLVLPASHKGEKRERAGVVVVGGGGGGPFPP